MRRAAADLSGAVVNGGSIRLAGGAVVPSAAVGIRAASPELHGGLRREGTELLFLTFFFSFFLVQTILLLGRFMQAIITLKPVFAVQTNARTWFELV